MDLFKKLFNGGGGDGDSPESAPANGKETDIKWASNAPSHWPSIELPRLGEPESPQMSAINAIRVLACIKRAIGNTNGGALALARIHTYLLTREGVVFVPGIVTDGSKEVPVFFYETASEQNAKRFNKAQNLLTDAGKGEAVYFCPDPLPEIAGTEPISKAMGPDAFSKLKDGEDLPKGRYAMWWGTGADPEPGASPDMELWSKIYEASRGINTYLVAMFAKGLELIESQDVGRIPLPDDAIDIALWGPDEVPMVMSMCSEKGIRFMLRAESCSPQYRTFFLEALLELFTGIRNAIEQNNLPKDDPLPEEPADWWKFLCHVQKQKAAEAVEADGVKKEVPLEKAQLIGAILFD